MADDPKDTGGFDDWLEEEPGPDTDPYAALADDADDPEAEISDWMAFTGSGEAASVEEKPEPDVGEAPSPEPQAASEDQNEGVPSEADGFDADELVVMPAVEASEADALDASGGTEDSRNDETGEIAIAPPEDTEPATSVDFDEWHGDDRADTDEIPIVAGADVMEASVTNVHDERPEDEDTGEIDAVADADGIESDVDDTGEMDVIAFPSPAGDADHDDPDEDAADDEVFPDSPDPAQAVATSAAFGELWGDDNPASDEGSDPETPFDISNEDYLQTATKEHAGLAAAIAEAEEENTEQVAIAAPIPGLESTVVGFEDVVEAEGHSKARTRRSGDLTARVITGIVLVIAFFASLIWAPVLIALATAVFVIGAGEFYTALARSGHKPVSIFGFIGIIGATVGSYFWGPVAIPVAFLLIVTMLLLFYAVVPGRKDPMGNLALTVTVMVWAGLGAFAGPIAVADDYRVLILAVVLTVAVMDIAQYFIGRALGRHQLAPWVSPKKTIEGLVGGVIVALAIGALLDFVDPFDLTSGLALGASVAVLVPLGDLAMSAAKRSLGLKDMGSILPGHGGFLDRIDGLLFTVPAAWAILMWAGLL